MIGSFLFFWLSFFISLNGRWLARDSTDKVNKPNDEWTSSWVSADNFWTRIKEFRHCVKRIQSIRRGSTWWEVQGLVCNQSRMSISFFHKGGRHWFRAACIYGLTYVTYSNHIWTWANSLKTSWKMGNYQNKIPQSDVWFHFPIWFKVGTLIIIRRIWVCCWLTFVLLLARPHPIKEEGPTLLYSRSIHIYTCALMMTALKCDTVNWIVLIWAGYISVCAIH